MIEALHEVEAGFLHLVAPSRFWGCCVLTAWPVEQKSFFCSRVRNRVIQKAWPGDNGPKVRQCQLTVFELRALGRLRQRLRRAWSRARKTGMWEILHSSRKMATLTLASGKTI